MQIKYFRSLLFLFVLFSVSFSVLACLQTVSIKNVVMPKLPPVSRTAAIYMTIDNFGETDVEIIGVETAVAHHTMIHKTVEQDGMAKMKHIDSIIVSAKSSLHLKPGSYHIMLMGLDKEKLAKPFELKVIFAKRDPLKVVVTPEI